MKIEVWDHTNANARFDQRETTMKGVRSATCLLLVNKVLFILRNTYNEKWSIISLKLLGRTDNAVKNYWNSKLNKRIQTMERALVQHFERKSK